MTAPDDPLARFRTPASPEQRAACLHPSDDRVPLSGDGWLCCLCGADCAPPEEVPAELTAERLDDLDRLAREAHGRAAKATVGPWRSEPRDGEYAEPGEYLVLFPNGEDASVVVESEARFIAAAREDVPVLSAAVLALSAEVRRLREEADR